MEEVKQEQTENKGQNSQSKWKFFLLGVATLVVLVGIFGVVYTVWAVKNVSDSRAVLKVAELLNLPVARVNGNAIPYSVYMEDLTTLNEFYKNAPEGALPPATEQQISDQVLSRLIVNSLIREIARENQLSVTDEDIKKAKDNIFQQYPSEAEVEAELQLQYGWDIPTYIEKIIKPLVLEQKVSEAFSLGEIATDIEGYDTAEELRASHILFRTDEEGVDENTVKVQAEAVLARAKNGEDFAELASEFGSDATKDEGGDLGWFGKGVMVPEFEVGAFATEVGQVSAELIKTQFGYHIIKVTDKRDVRNFGVYLNDKIDNANVEMLIKKVHDPLEEYRAAKENVTDQQEAIDQSY